MARATETGEVTTQFRLLVPCTAAGRIAISSNYLVEYFKGQEGIVNMGVNSPSAPALFTTPGMPDVVIMPMFVQWNGEPAAETPPAEEPAQETSEGEAQPEEAQAASPPPTEDTQAATSAPAKERKKRKAARRKAKSS